MINDDDELEGEPRLLTTAPAPPPAAAYLEEESYLTSSRGSSKGLSRSSRISYATNLSGFFVSDPELEEFADTELLDTVCGECVPLLLLVLLLIPLAPILVNFFGLRNFDMLGDAVELLSPLLAEDMGYVLFIPFCGDGDMATFPPAKNLSTGIVAPSRNGLGLER